MNDKPSPIRETNDEARRSARILLRSARYAALAVLDPSNGYPSVSRVLVGTDIDGVPVILISSLSAHTKALAADPRASLLFGEPGKGDPLAYPRLSVQCRAQTVDRESNLHQRLRRRFLARHPKSKLYIDFADFHFVRLQPQAASLNGGFGRAYSLAGNDLEISSPANEKINVNESLIVQDLLGSFDDLPALLAGTHKPQTRQKWAIFGLDSAGIDLNSGDKLLRIEFDEPSKDPEEIRLKITKIVRSIP